MLQQCQLNKEPGLKTRVKGMKIGHVIKMHGQVAVFSLMTSPSQYIATPPN